jgi:hypothetical protein
MRADAVDPFRDGRRNDLKPDLQWRKRLRPRAPTLASTQLLYRGPGRKLTRRWVKIVVDIRSPTLRPFIDKSIFVCFVS